GTVGVDRNSVGAVATLADPQNGKVLHLGFNPARTKAGWRGQKANLQSLGKRRLLHKIRNKQCRRTKYEKDRKSTRLNSSHVAIFALSYTTLFRSRDCRCGPEFGRRSSNSSRPSEWKSFAFGL